MKPANRFIFSSFWSRSAVLAYDTGAAAVAFLTSLWIAYGTNLDFRWLRNTDFVLWGVVTFATLASMVFVLTGQYRSIWRYTSLRDLLTMIRGVVVTSLIFLPFAFMMTRASDLPRSALPFAAFVLLTLIVAPRLITRMLLERGTPALKIGRGDAKRIPAIVIGVDPRAESFAREVMRDPDAVFTVLGFLAPDAKWNRHELHGIRVLGAVGDVRDVVQDLQNEGQPVQRLILADETLDQAVVSQLLEAATELGVTLGRLPRINDLSAADVESHKFDVKPVALEDLLQRPQKVLDRSSMRDLIAGKRVLVTGAGGSIGSELVRQVAGFGPSQLTLLENSEFNLYSIDQEISVAFPAVPRQTALCDVRNAAAVDRWFEQIKPEIVFHAAAVKHVPMIEEHPLEGVSVNIVGTTNIAEASLKHGVTAMVMISTDKAVNPKNVMGATKRLAEAYCQALDLYSAKLEGATTRFFTVRFGNVLGSTGSVVPLFQRQLAAGGPLTVTHPDITRYFMTIPEAVQLILQAAAMGVRDGGDRGKIFVLDMGEPIKIVDLARQMIRLSGKRPDIDVKIKFVGLRPGEKLYEELLHSREELVPSSQKGLLLGMPRAAELQLLRRDIDQLAQHATRGDREGALATLRRCVPEYEPDVQEPPAIRPAAKDAAN